MRIPGLMACACVPHAVVPEFYLASPRAKWPFGEHPPYRRVKAIGALASHQLWTIGAIVLPHTSHFPHSPLLPPVRHSANSGGSLGGGILISSSPVRHSANSGGPSFFLLPLFATRLTWAEHSYFFLISPSSPLANSRGASLLLDLYILISQTISLVLTRVGTLFSYCTAEAPGLTVLGSLKIFSLPTQSTLLFVWLHDTV